MNNIIELTTFITSNITYYTISRRNENPYTLNDGEWFNINRNFNVLEHPVCILYKNRYFNIYFFKSGNCIKPEEFDYMSYIDNAFISKNKYYCINLYIEPINKKSWFGFINRKRAIRAAMSFINTMNRQITEYAADTNFGKLSFAASDYNIYEETVKDYIKIIKIK